MRTIAVFAFSLACAGLLSGRATAQDSSKAVTYRTPAVTLSKALEDLSAKTGMNLRPAANIADELILIRVKDAKASDVMKKVAEAIGAEWVMEGDVYRLARPSSLNEAERRAELAEKIKKLQAAVDKHTADVRQTPNWTIEDAKKAQQSNKKRGDGEFAVAIAQDDGSGGPARTFSFGGPGEVSPASRAMARLVPLLNIADLASLEPGERIVYSTQPTRMQKSLPNKTFEIFQTLTKEQALWDQLQESSRSSRSVPRPGGGPEPQTGPPAKALVIASKMGMGDAINLTMLVADANGNVITTQMSFLGDIFFGSGESGQPTKPQGGPVKVSPESLELAKMLSSGGGMMGQSVSISIQSDGEADNVAFVGPATGPTKRAKLTPEWRSRVTSPNSWEPLASIPSDLVLGYADATEANLVASIPDDALMKAARLAQTENLSSSAIESNLKGSWGLSVKSAEGFVVVRPNRPYTARRQKVDRAKLERMLKYLDRNGRISLDELAAYAYAHPVAPAFDSLDTAMIRLLDPATADQEFMRSMTGQRDMLRLWGAMSSAQRQSLLNGIPVPITNMNNEQQGIVARLTFQSQDGPRLLQGGGGRGREFGGGPFGFMSNLRNERTEFLPYGLPNDLVLNLRTQVREAVIATNSESGNGMIFSPQTLAMTRNMKMNIQGLHGETMETATYDTYQMADQNTLDFTFQYGRIAQLLRQLTDTVAQRGSKAGNYDSLPEAFRKQVDEAAARIQNRSQRVRQSDGGGGPPPR
ncbi:MAG: hypothetical protein HONBIEJF_02757 [Fimbriimonadaceae bacterium]|nr:hypothetical protein [Fimbriimonadaceae bacterium]